MTTMTRSSIGASPPVEPARTALPHLEVVHGKGPRRTAEKWFLALMITSLCVFSVALATFVLRPAIVTTSSTSTWNQDGP